MGAALHQVSLWQRIQSQGVMRLAILAIVTAAIIAPIIASLWQVLRASFGVLPVLGQMKLGLGAWQALAQTPGIGHAIWLTLITGFASTGLSFILALGLVAALHGPSARRAARLLTPFLAIPHAAMAVGLAFVLAPSGWIARAVAPVFGWARPPDLATVGDAYGAALTLGLTIKEMPFLALVILAALGQIPLRQSFAAGRALGYGHGAVWAKVVLPQIWPLIRLPVYIVLAFGLSVIDMAIILGPSHPPTFAVMLARLYTSPDLSLLLPASAGAMALLALVGGSFIALFLLEKLIAWVGLAWIEKGHRGGGLSRILSGLAGIAGATLMLGALGAISLAVWSLSWRWSWPDLLPSGFSLKAWASATWAGPAVATLTIAILATFVALAACIAWLEGEARAQRRSPIAEFAIYVPLLVPQISFLFGMNILALQLGAGGNMAAVIWAHVMFVFPYVMMALSGPWRALDPRFDRAAASLGLGPWRRLIFVKMPMLLAPILTAVAIGIAVSVAQYLPTLFLGAGRIATLTTEAVTLSTSSDRRVLAVVASLQAALPFAAYFAAFVIPMILYKNRQDLQGTTL